MIEALVTSLWQCKHLLNGCDDVILLEGWEEKGKRVKTEREREWNIADIIDICINGSNSGGQQMCV